MEQLKDQTSTQSNNLKLMGLLDDMRAKNDLLSEGILRAKNEGLLSEGILFIYAIYPQPIKACSLIMTGVCLYAKLPIPSDEY